ncbi:MAG: lipid-A-disaccharide synthase, partial [Campylobacterales bacterium]
MKKVLVSSLEYSSNSYLDELFLGMNDMELFGIFDFGGRRGEYSLKDFSIMGFADVFRKLPLIKKAQNYMLDIASECDVVLLSDSSSFNLPLAKKLKKHYPNKPIYYFILPQVWAWKSWRAKQLEKYCDKLLGIIPFEQKMYSAKYEFVGHPLLDRIERPNQKANGDKIAFMPGSRVSEIRSLMPLFKEVSQKLGKTSTLIIPPFLKDRVDEIYGDVSGFELYTDVNEGLVGCEFAYVCSGTATLEVSLKGIPLVLAYKAKMLDYLIVKSLVNVDFAGLANIFGQNGGFGQVHEELLQGD